MAAKGSIVKAETFKTIMDMFPGSFMYNDGKELRINCIEDGNLVQLKLTLTAAKEPIEAGGDIAVPGIEKWSGAIQELSNAAVNKEPTEEEKNIVNDLISKLGL